MSYASGLLIPVCAAGMLICGAFAQKNQPDQLGARDMFYHPVKAAEAGGTPVPSTGPGTPPAKSKTAPAKKTSPDPPPVAHNSKTDPPVGSRPPLHARDEVAIIKAADRAPVPTAGPPLGLKYTLVKKGKKDAEVATDAIFHDDDKIQIKIETNLPAYLYVITLGSSRTWKVQVPSADVPPGSNRVEAMKPYLFPPKAADGVDQAFTFHGPKGAEKIFLIASREPVADIQDQIYGLQNGKPKPAAQPEAPPDRHSTMVQARLDLPDDKISEMRELYSRDLIIERVNPETTGDKAETKEFAMYVVNRTGDPKSRLVADISLEHQ